MFNYKAIHAAIDGYMKQVATVNGVDDPSTKFAVTPTVQQKLETKMQESSEFLGRINMIGVTAQEGEAVAIGVSSPIASRTDTSTTGERETRDVHTTEADRYRCEQTNFDTHIRYATLDAWAHLPDFQARVAASILRRQALDRIMIGWNGTSVAATSNIGTNPLLQDVNKGWIKKLRDGKAANVISEIAAGSGKVQIGDSVTDANGYRNLDALIFDMVGGLDPWYQDDTDLVAICGRKLLSDKYFTIVNRGDTNVETQAGEVLMSTRRLGGLQAIRVPHFPPNAVMVTKLPNLSIYWQKEARRRLMVDNPKRDRFENYESSNDAYVIEDFGAAMYAENIEIVA